MKPNNNNDSSIDEDYDDDEDYEDEEDEVASDDEDNDDFVVESKPSKRNSSTGKSKRVQQSGKRSGGSSNSKSSSKSSNISGRKRPFIDDDDADISEDLSAIDDEEDEDEEEMEEDDLDTTATSLATQEDDDEEEEQQQQQQIKKQSTPSSTSKKSKQQQPTSSTTTTNSISSPTTPPKMNVSSPTGSRRQSAAAASTTTTTEEEKPNAIQYHCDYCQKDISNVVRIRCSVCEDFDLCVECFSVGVEIHPHKNDHDYHVIDNMHFPMFTEDWGADEELLLLEAVEMFGMGNWNEVSENVGHKSPMECKSHYFAHYLNTATSPLPDTSKVLTTSENVHFKRAKSTNYNPNDRKNKSSAVPDQTEGPSGPVTDSVGFMKNRGQFEYEFDNDAEVVVKDLVFDQDDSHSDREIKLSVLETYNQRLDERIRRRNFITEKGLLEYKKIERKRCKNDKEIYNSLKVFLQAMSKEDHEKLVNGIILEKTVRDRIEQLQHYRSNGIRTLEEANQYDEEKRKRDAEKNMRKSKSELSYHNEKPLVHKPVKQQIKEKEEIFLGIGKGANERKSLKIRKNASLEMEGLPNVDNLSIKEKQLCSQIRLLPQQYLIIKELILSESFKNNGKLKFSQALKLIKLESSKVAKIYEFFELAGWIKRDQTSPSSNSASSATQNITTSS